MYTLLIAEDEHLVREGIAKLIDYTELNITTVLKASDGQMALDLFTCHRPHIVLTDINMPKLDGIQLAEQIKKVAPETMIIFLTGYDYFDYAIRALKLGANDYLLKPVRKSEIESRLHQTIQMLSTRQKKLYVQTIVEDSLKNVDDSGTIRENIESSIHKELSNSNLTLKMMADTLGFSTTYFSTVVKKELGMTFQDYVSQQRMERAKVLLLSTNLKIYEVAEQVGFDDVNYFSTRFKHYTHHSPKDFRKGSYE